MCFEFWNSNGEKHNGFLLATRIRPKIRSGAGDCAESVSRKTSISASSHQKSVFSARCQRRIACSHYVRSFLGSVQFYAKFLPPMFASVAEPLYRLTRKGHRWVWGSEEKAVFRRLKELLSAADVLAYFDPSLPSGVACDASAVGIGTTLFHHYSDGSERPIANISKTLTAVSASTARHK